MAEVLVDPMRPVLVMLECGTDTVRLRDGTLTHVGPIV
jgi:hypothetical protein